MGDPRGFHYCNTSKSVPLGYTWRGRVGASPLTSFNLSLHFLGPVPARLSICSRLLNFSSLPMVVDRGELMKLSGSKRDIEGASEVTQEASKKRESSATVPSAGTALEWGSPSEGPTFVPDWEI